MPPAPLMGDLDIEEVNMEKFRFRVSEEGKNQIVINVKKSEVNIDCCESKQQRKKELYVDPKLLMVGDSRYFSYELRQFRERFAI